VHFVWDTSANLRDLYQPCNQVKARTAQRSVKWGLLGLVPEFIELCLSCKPSLQGSLHASGCMAVKPSQIGKAGKRVLNDKFFKKAKVNRNSTKCLPLHTAGFAVCMTALQGLQAEGYLARSAFKLQELQQKHKLIAPGNDSDLLS